MFQEYRTLLRSNNSSKHYSFSKHLLFSYLTITLHKSCTESTGIRELWSNLQRLTAGKFPPFLPGMSGNLWHVPNGQCFNCETSVERQTQLTVLEISALEIGGNSRFVVTLRTCKIKIIKKKK
jgi:hypothetical protein